MNELLFFLHLFLVVGFSFAALRLGSMGLIALMALQAVLANLFVVKQMTLFGFDVTCSDVFAVGGLLSLNLLQEFYGKEAAQKAVKISFLSMLFFVLMSQVHLAYQPSAFDLTHGSFASIFSSTPRIFVASIATYFIVQQIDLTFFSWLKQKLEGRNFPLRLGLSLFLSQAFDTVLFSYLGLYGLVGSLFDIILVSLIVKWIAIGCSAPFTIFAKRFARVQ